MVGMSGHVPVEAVVFQTFQHEAVVISARHLTPMVVVAVHQVDQVTGHALVDFLTLQVGLNVSSANLLKMVATRKLLLMISNWITQTKNFSICVICYCTFAATQAI